MVPGLETRCLRPSRADGVFVLDPRLAADTVPVADLPLCALLLMNDSRFPWLILVPRIAGAVEIVDLPSAERNRLMEEVARASAALRTVSKPDKLNVGALGNMVAQLHVHVVGRFRGDSAWPGPVWGSGASSPYLHADRDRILTRLRAVLDSP